MPLPDIAVPKLKSADDAPAWLSAAEKVAWADGYNACVGGVVTDLLASVVAESAAAQDEAISVAVQTVAVPADQILDMFEPWDELDLAIERLNAKARTTPAVAEATGVVVAAREALRGALYPVLREYQDAMKGSE